MVFSLRPPLLAPHASKQRGNTSIDIRIHESIYQTAVCTKHRIAFLARHVSQFNTKSETLVDRHHVVEIFVQHTSARSNPGTPISIPNGSPGVPFGVDFIDPRPQLSPPPFPTPLPPSVSGSSPCPSSLTGSPTSHWVSPWYSSLLPWPRHSHYEPLFLSCSSPPTYSRHH